MKAGEEREENSGDDGERDGEHRGDDAIEPNPGHLEQRVAPEPHPVSGAHWERLGYHVLETHLNTHTRTAYTSDLIF